MSSNRLKELRDKAKLSQQELGEKVSMAGQTIGLLESGKRNMKDYQILAIAEALNVHPGELLREIGPEYSSATPGRGFSRSQAAAKAADRGARLIDDKVTLLAIQCTFEWMERVGLDRINRLSDEELSAIAELITEAARVAFLIDDDELREKAVAAQIEAGFEKILS